MRIPKIYKRENDPSIKRTIVEVDKLAPIEYVPDVDFDDDKSVRKYVKTIKVAMRNSMEYKSLMSFLKDKMHFNKCFFFPKVQHWRDSKITIEMHHTSLVAEDLILIVLRKRYAEGEDYDVQSVVEELMEEHYIGNISLTALSATAHSLVHEEEGLFIPLQMCDFGDTRKFVDKYKNYIPKDILGKFTNYVLVGDAVEHIEDILPDYLDRSYIYYKVKDDGIQIPCMDKILEFIDIDTLED